MLKLTIATAVAIVALTGCAGVAVSDGKNDLKGIPFYVKVPVVTQDTLRATSELTVQLKVSEVVEVDDKSKVVRSADVPLSGAIRLADTPHNRAVVDAAIAAIPSHSRARFESTLAAVNQLLAQQLVALMATPLTDGTCAAQVASVVSNSWTISMVADPRRYYIVTKQPVIGSSNTNFEFSADGTMTKASADVTNDTAKTLLALFPITAKLTKQWGLEPESPDKATADAELASKEYSLSGAAPAKKTIRIRKSVKVDASISSVKTIYTLRKSEHLGDQADLNSYLGRRTGGAPLTLCDAIKGANGVQLVSIGSPGDQSEEKQGDALAKAWQVQGIVMPPKAADASSDK